MESRAHKRLYCTSSKTIKTIKSRSSFSLVQGLSKLYFPSSSKTYPYSNCLLSPQLPFGTLLFSLAIFELSILSFQLLQSFTFTQFYIFKLLFDYLDSRLEVTFSDQPVIVSISIIYNFSSFWSIFSAHTMLFTFLSGLVGVPHFLLCLECAI